MCQEHLKLVKKSDVTVSQSQNLLQVNIITTVDKRRPNIMTGTHKTCSK